MAISGSWRSGCAGLWSASMSASPAMNRLEKARDLLAKGKAVRALGPTRDATFNLRSHHEAEVALAVIAELRAALSGSGRDGYLDELDRRATVRRGELSWTRDVDELGMRLGRLANLLLADVGGDANVDLGPVLPFIATATNDGEIEVVAGLASFAHDWRDALFDGYTKGFEAFADVTVSTLREHSGRIERALKTLAVDLLSRGAKVEGLSLDAVPIVAYGLVQGHIPFGAAGDPELTAERSNDALLFYADWMSSIGPDARLIFLELFRLSFALGVAQRYATNLNLTHL
jgi:hypothetical protein